MIDTNLKIILYLLQFGVLWFNGRNRLRDKEGRVSMGVMNVKWEG